VRLTEKHANWLVVVFFVALIAVVFQQVFTDMVEQGIASGGPYDNAAAYPEAVAVLIGVMIAAQAGILLFRREPSEGAVSLQDARRPAGLIAIFGLYLALLGVLGYHLTTAPMLAAIMVLCGLRRPTVIIASALAVAFGLAYFFEVYLKVVLPGGIFRLNIPW
jgi:putative tricarboxylic transport membrane protein